MTSNISSKPSNTKIDKCPMGCGCTEDAFHYMYCLSEEMYFQCEKEKKTLMKALHKLKTSPLLMDAICDRIDCALNQVEYDLHADSHETLFYPAFSQLFI
jgi:hypothetical protein